ncbi:MAG: hypothetical protein GVY18_09100 [Bacteroidetes bacterium]|nr:hypothetical protein [Bacteroidota bacterium]
MKALDGAAVELVIYDEIGGDMFGEGVTPKRVQQMLADAGSYDEIQVSLHSPGGIAFDGIAIYNILAKDKARVIVNVDGLALSAASIIAMAGDEIRMRTGSLLMIHDPWTVAMGDALAMRESAERLDRAAESIASIYARRTGKELSEMRELMRAETWLDAAEAAESGFADVVLDAEPLAAFGDVSRYRNPPDRLLAPATIAASAQAPAPQHTTPGRAASSSGEPMKIHTTILAALGLESDADVDAAEGAIQSLQTKAKLGKAIETIADASGDEAVGKVRAAFEAQAQLPKLQSQLAEREAQAHRAEFEALIERGLGKTGEPARLTKPMADFERSEFEDALNSGEAESAIKRLRAFLKVAPGVLPKASQQPAESSGVGGSELTWNGLRYAELKPGQRHALKNENPELFAAMRDEAIAAGEI